MPRPVPLLRALLFVLLAAAAPAADLAIPQIQGPGLSSPVEGQTVTTRGNVVTAVADDGFFIQAPAGEGDADAQTSDGIFVFTSTAPGVTPGDRVDVSGVVKEYFGLTEIEPGTVTVVSRGNALPPALALLPSADPERAALEMERLEGMLVHAAGALAVSGTDRFGDFKAVVGAPRPFREAGIEYPGAAGLPVWDGNPEIFEIDTDRIGSGASVIGGATVERVEGPLGFAFGDYQIWATALSFTNPDYPRPVRARAAGELTIASQNLLRLVDDDAAALALRLRKFSRLVRDVLRAPDVLAVSEAENLQVLRDLAAQIAADDGSLDYEALLLEGNDPGSIDVGFLVRSTVAIASVAQILPDETFAYDGRSYDLFDRPPLLLRAAYVANGAPFDFAVLAVHLRSLNDVEASEFARIKRHRGALRLAEAIRDLLAAEPELRLVVTGDFNAFEMTDGFVDVMGQITGAADPRGAMIPVEPVQGYAGLRNETGTVRPEERYSYLYEGTAQVLDHALTSPALARWVRQMAFARANADAPASAALDPTAAGSTDHDATVLFVMTDRDGDGIPDDREACPPGGQPGSRRRLVTIGCP
jgi:hypothetical protein